MAKLPLSTIHHQSPPDLNQARIFLNALDPLAKDFLFVAIEDGHAPKVTRQPASDTVLNSLAQWNSLDYNIYVTVNETNNGTGTSRLNDEVTKFRCIYADDDGKNQAKPYPIPPSAIIETSPGKKQVYWFLQNSPNKEEWDGVQQTLVNEYGGDPNARDAARILRIPGLYNAKQEYETSPLCFIKTINPEIRYTWEQIKQAFPMSQVVSSTGKVQGESLNKKETLEQFITGTNYHQAGIALAGYYYNKGIRDAGELVSMLQDLVDIQGDPSDPRFNHRRNVDIPASVSWVLKERLKEQPAKTLPIFGDDEVATSDKDKYTTLPIPGGGMWYFYRWIRSLMRYPNDTIAIAYAEHIVSVFGGGIHHIMKNTTTRKRVVLAPPGTGKNTIVTALGQIEAYYTDPVNTNNNLLMLRVPEFIGSETYSPYNQHKEIEQNRIRSFIVNEAGVSSGSKAGDISGLMQYQLNVLSNKLGSPVRPKKLSEASNKFDAEKQTKDVYGGIWVYLHESTVESYAKHLNDSGAYSNGDMSRSDIFFIDVKDDEVNSHSHEAGLTDEVKQMLELMVQKYFESESQDGTTSSVLNKFYNVDYSDIENDLIELERDTLRRKVKAHKEGDEVMQSESARRFEKIITTVLTCAIADAAFAGTYPEGVRATKVHLDYAIKRQEAIDRTVQHHAVRGALTLPMDEAMATMRKKLSLYTPAMLHYGCHIAKEDGTLYINNSFLTNVFQRKAFKDVINTIYRGDTKRGKEAIIYEMEQAGMIETLRYDKVKSNWHISRVPYKIKKDVKPIKRAKANCGTS